MGEKVYPKVSRVESSRRCSRKVCVSGAYLRNPAVHRTSGEAQFGLCSQ